MKLFNLFFLILAFIVTAHAKTFTGTGYDVLKKYSEQNAKSDLLNKMEVALKKDIGTYKSILKPKDQKYFEFISRDLPLLGLEIKVFEEKGEIKTKAILDNKSLKIYKRQISRLKHEIFDYYELFQISKNKTNKYSILIKLYKDIQEFYRFKIVSALLGDKRTEDIRIKLESIEKKLFRVQKKRSSIESGAFDLTKGIYKNKIYIEPLKLIGSKEVTSLSRTLKENMAEKLKDVEYSSRGDFYLKGFYKVMPKNIFLTTNLYDRNNMIINTNTAMLTSLAYEGVRYLPKVSDFDASLKSSIINNGRLSISLKVDGHDRVDGIDLSKSDLIDVTIISNKPACFYVVRHLLKDDKRYSYLLPIGKDDDPYILEVGEKELNQTKFILQNVLINKPLGDESYHMFASRLDYKGSCHIVPPKCKNNSDERCQIEGDPVNVIGKIRSEIFQKGNRSLEKAESSIRITTF